MGAPRDHLRRAIASAQEWAVRAQDDLSAAEFFPTDIAGRTVSVLADATVRVLAAPPTPAGTVPISRLINEMALTKYNKGFTFSPTPYDNNTFASPENGHHCVALPGTNLPVKWAVTPERDDRMANPVPKQKAEQFREWVRFMAPVLRTGHAWIGGYRPEPSENAETLDETFDAEATLVFLPEHYSLASESAEAWKQRSMWTIKTGRRDNDGNHLDGIPTDFDHEPCGSVFLARQRLREQRSA